MSLCENKIPTQVFMDQIEKLGIEYTEETKKRLIFVFDEDFNEEITYAEFIDTCDAYGAALPSQMPDGYFSVAKRALMKLTKKMQKKNIKPDHIFKMKDSDNVDASDFMQFVDKTLRLNLRKREQHALIDLCDSNKSNTINKDEFIALYKKGERLIESNPNFDPKVNNFFASTDEPKEGSAKKASKSELKRQETSTSYSGDVKEQMLKMIVASPHLSIEEYFEKECMWQPEQPVSFNEFKGKSDKLFEIPAGDLKTFFDKCDLFSSGRIKMAQVATELKSIIHKLDDESMSLLTIEDIEKKYDDLTPRSATGALVKEINLQCESQGTKPSEVFNSNREKSKNYITKEQLKHGFRTCCPKLSREVVEEALKGFKEDRINYNDFLVYFSARDSSKPKSDELKLKAQEKWITKYTSVLDTYGLNAMDLLKEADKNKDGKLELSELDKVIKQYIKNKDLTYTDLQSIIDAFDANNDGSVTTDEYKNLCVQYAPKPKPKAPVEVQKDGKLVNLLTIV